MTILNILTYLVMAAFIILLAGFIGKTEIVNGTFKIERPLTAICFLLTVIFGLWGK